MKSNKPLYKAGDKVKILDGSETEDYTGSWAESMADFVGRTATIENALWCGSGYGYLLDMPLPYTWDERCLAPVLDETIVIYRKDREVIALDKRTGQTAKARCNPSDEFDFAVGARLAFGRLIPPAKTEPEPDTIKVGDRVKVIETGEVFPKDYTWVAKHVTDKKAIARFSYGDDMNYKKGVRELPVLFTVLAVAENKAYISRSAFSAPCYLVGLDGLKKC